MADGASSASIEKVDNGGYMHNVKTPRSRTSLEELETQSGGSEYNTLHKGLQSRHIQLIALGGCIGTGLFVGTSWTLHNCGAAPLLLSFILISTIVYPIMCSLAEMICYLPQQGSVPELVSRYVDPSLGFATGWNYAYAYAILVAAELSAAASVVSYWENPVPMAAWITIFMVVVVGLNFTAVKYYGEAEFWFASIKLICILGLLIVSLVIFFGGAPTHDRIGFRYWKNPGPFAMSLAPGSTGRFLDVWRAVIKSAFAFILSPELIGIACVEAQDTRRNTEKASRRFIYRIIFFYVSCALMIGVIVSRTDPKLIEALEKGAPGAASSPFVQGIANAGIPVLDHVINVAILSSAWSAGNSFMYASTRMVLALAREGNAPKFLTKINRYGVPYNAVIVCTLVACLAYLNVKAASANVFQWLSNICTISGFIGWFAMGIAYIRFRRAIVFNNLQSRVPYQGPLQPYIAYYFTFMTVVVCLTNGFHVFIKGHWNIVDFVAAYVTLPIYLILYLGHKLWFRTRFYIPVQQIDVMTGLVEAEEESRMTPVRVPKNLWEKFLYWLL
ncbi:AaceriAFR156Wp [[Ashbya] aceris (nom. inval.)]|nr:AaceriAFR156Wp [[Ashbya] aceris (nom. inval.)]